jgi:23S rRNA (guanine2445-N2)-methyltransferase / 23S rRNA (guanine2069-N7)-methyltransferase
MTAHEPMLSLFATAPKGVEPLLAEELRALGATGVKETRAGVAFEGPLALAYRACLWSRVASRILLPIASFPAADPEALYAGARAIDWVAHLAPEGTLAVDFATVASRITHTRYGALKVKDAVVDQFRDRFGVRPSVDVQRPDLRINVYLRRDQATVSIDLSGESLHRRGYRVEGVAAPMKENLAAAILLRAGWSAIAGAGGAFVDPMCGSGTLPIEAALMAADSAPGLQRGYFGFLGWLRHDAPLWEALLVEARVRREAGLARLPPIAGYDADPAAVRAAIANVAQAGLRGHVHVERRELVAAEPPGAMRPPDASPTADATVDAASNGAPGLVAVNPPYGERLGERARLEPLYAALGERLKARFAGWRAVVFTGNPELGKRMGLRAVRTHTMYNGALECRLLTFEIVPQRHTGAELGPPRAPAPLGPGAEQFANRLRKNLRHLGRWAAREDVACWRIYDADLPDYAVAVDLYERWVHVQEYEAPKSIDPAKARRRLEEAMAVIPQVLNVAAADVHLKVRRRQKGAAQYERLAATGRFHEVREANCRFLVNFTDYLDTGLFLDHRITRAMVQRLARGRRFLNLFCYTGTATVHAAVGGALSTTSVDMSQTYLEWARRNLALNGIGAHDHELVQADCLDWLDAARGRYGLIFLDPPTFSNSKRMDGTFDVQRDHVPLLHAAARLLERDGVLIFSTNFRRFKLDRAALADLQVEDITRATIPKDFERNPRIHACWRITRR